MKNYSLGTWQALLDVCHGSQEQNEKSLTGNYILDITDFFSHSSLATTSHLDLPDDDDELVADTACQVLVETWTLMTNRAMMLKVDWESLTSQCCCPLCFYVLAEGPRPMAKDTPTGHPLPNKRGSSGLCHTVVLLQTKPWCPVASASPLGFM